MSAAVIRSLACVGPSTRIHNSLAGIVSLN